MSAIGLAFVVSVLSDTQLSSVNAWRCLSSYGALGLYALSSGALQHTLGVLSPSLGFTFAMAASTLGAAVFALPFYAFRMFLVSFIFDSHFTLTSLNHS
jgi:zinc transporter 5/7